MEHVLTYSLDSIQHSTEFDENRSWHESKIDQTLHAGLQTCGLDPEWLELTFTNQNKNDSTRQ